MRKYILLVVFLGFLSGCAYFDERISAMQACGGDKVCLEQVVNSGKAAKAVGDATGVPWAGAAAGGVVAFLTLFFARKRKEETK
jgi:hypothetical protein